MKKQLLWLAAGLLLGVAPSVLLLLAGLLLPALLARAVDRAAGRPPGAAPMLFAIAGSVAPAIAFLHTGPGLGPAEAVLGDIALSGPCWLGTGLGWSLDQLLPGLVGLLLEGQARARVVALLRLRGRHLKSWDIEAPGK